MPDFDIVPAFQRCAEPELIPKNWSQNLLCLPSVITVVPANLQVVVMTAIDIKKSVIWGLFIHD